MTDTKALFPVFEVPSIQEADAAVEQLPGSLDFDFASGDFRLDGAGRMVACGGREAFRQWCVKAAMTERGAYLAYGPDFGTELDEAFSQPDKSAVESALERAVTEAIMSGPRAEYVRGFSFSWEGGRLQCAFSVKGQEWEEQPVNLQYKT